MEVIIKNLNGLDWIALVIILVGALSWGLIGFFNFDLVVAICVDAAHCIYATAGLSAIYVAIISPSLAHKMQPGVQ